jgi:histidinol-phosphate aminotransferase
VIESLPATTPFVGPEALSRRTGRDIELRLGANESQFGPSPHAVAAMNKQASRAQNYGDPECFLLRSELSHQLNVGIGNVSIGAGIDELLGLCCRLYVQPATPIVTTIGSYPTFDYVASACGAEFHRVPYAREALDLDALVDIACRVDARILYVANPDYPSGSWHSPERIVELRRRMPQNCVLLLDEAYSDFAPATPALDPSDPQVIRLRTFSKVHGMAGMRVGYSVGHEDPIKALDKIRLHFGVNSVAQAGALASLKDPSHVAFVVAENERGRVELTEFFATFGLRTLPSYTNFVTVDVGSKLRAEAILARLWERGVFIRKPGLPPLDGCIRVTIGRPEQRARFADIFRSILQSD